MILIDLRFFFFSFFFFFFFLRKTVNTLYQRSSDIIQRLENRKEKDDDRDHDATIVYEESIGRSTKLAIRIVRRLLSTDYPETTNITIDLRVVARSHPPRATSSFLFENVILWTWAAVRCKKKKKVRIARIDGWNERTNERERRNIGSWPLSGLCLRLVRGTVVMRPCRRIRMVEIDRYRDWMEHRVWPCVPHEIQMRP